VGYIPIYRANREYFLPATPLWWGIGSSWCPFGRTGGPDSRDTRALWSVLELLTQRTTPLFRHVLEVPETLSEGALLFRGQGPETVETIPDHVALLGRTLIPVLESPLGLLPLLRRKSFPAPGTVENVFTTLKRHPVPGVCKRSQNLMLFFAQALPIQTFLGPGKNRQKQQNCQYQIFHDCHACCPTAQR